MLEVSNVEKRFGGVKAVDGVSFEIERSEISGLIGPNGAGKTTLFNLVTGLYRIDSGAIQFEARPIHQMAPHRIAALGISRTFQNIRLFGRLSALENVMVARHTRTKSTSLGAVLNTRAFRAEEQMTRAKSLELLAFVGLERFADAPAGDLPYGEQRRLEIARALAAEPSLLLLDEPAAGMNETESASLVHLIRRIRDELGVTILLIEHDMHVVMNLCDRVNVLNFGRLLAKGSPAEIQSNPAVIEAYLGSDALDA